MKEKLLLPVVLIFLLIPATAAQTVEISPTVEISTELEARAIELLRETSAMANTLNSPENRITFTLKTADILWEYDEREAVRLFRVTMEDTRRYVVELNGRLNQIEGAGASSNWATAQSSRAMRQKITKVTSITSNLVTTVAKHDPETALRFLQEIRQSISNRELERRTRRGFDNLENRVVRKIAEQDVTKSLELARQKLSEGFSYHVVSLLGTIYRKDAEKGAAFAKEVIARAESFDPGSTWFLLRLLRMGSSIRDNLTASGLDKPPMFSEADLQKLAQTAGDKYLAQFAAAAQRRGPGSRRPRWISTSNLNLIEKYAPQKAGEIKRTQQAARQALNTRAGTGNQLPQPPTSDYSSARRRMSQARRDFQEELRKSVENLSAEGITPEQRRETLNQTRGKILAVNNDDVRFTNLLWLAQVSRGAGEDEFAEKLLEQAEGFANRQPETRTEFGKNKQLAAGYAGIRPARSFAILEDLVYRLNGVIESYIKYNHFTGGNRAGTENGELLINRSSRQFTQYLSFSPQTYRTLAEADFERLRGLADKFTRPELRVEIRLNMIAALLSAVRPVDGREVPPVDRRPQ